MRASDFKEISAGQFFSITGGLVAGMLLASLKDQLILIPGFLILIPGFLEMKGNISGSLASRIGSALHLGTIKAEMKNTSFIRENILATFSLVIIVSFVLGLFSLAATYLFFRVVYLKIIYIALVGGIFANMIMIPSTIYMSFWLFRHGYDPDNIMGPYVTTTGDVLSMFSLFLAVMVIA